MAKITRKLVVLGASRVGKSSIISRLIYDNFEQEYYPTTGASFRYDKEIEETNYEITITDTPGQDEQDMFQVSYTLDVDGYILIYSVDDKDSFQQSKRIFDKLMDIVGPNAIPTILVANKIDLTEERVVSREEGKEMAQLMNIPYIETTAKDDQKVEDVFMELLEKIREKNRNRIGWIDYFLSFF